MRILVKWMDPCGFKCANSCCEEKLDCSWLLTQHTMLEPFFILFSICQTIITLCFGTSLRYWVTCEISWQTSDMRPMFNLSDNHNIMFWNLLRDWVACEISWQTSDMRPMIMSDIGRYYGLHNKHDQTWHYKTYSQSHLFYHATFSSQYILWLVTINCRHKQISIFFIMMMTLLFSPLRENEINQLWKLYKTFTILSHPLLSHINRFWDHNKQ
jgi:hypothetical protein